MDKRPVCGKTHRVHYRWTENVCLPDGEKSTLVVLSITTEIGHILKTEARLFQVVRYCSELWCQIHPAIDRAFRTLLVIHSTDDFLLNRPAVVSNPDSSTWVVSHRTTMAG